MRQVLGDNLLLLTIFLSVVVPACIAPSQVAVEAPQNGPVLPFVPRPEVVPWEPPAAVPAEEVKTDIKVYSSIGEGDCLPLEEEFFIILAVDSPPTRIVVGFTLVMSGGKEDSIVFLYQDEGKMFELSPDETYKGPFSFEVTDADGVTALYQAGNFPFFTYLGKSREKEGEFCVKLPDELERVPPPGSVL